MLSGALLTVAQKKETPHWATRIREMRLARGLSQKALSELLGVSRQAVQAWESGRNQPDLEAIQQLCSVFGCTPEDLIGRPQISPPTGLAARLKERREAAGWSKGEVATYFHLPPTILDRWESGEVVPGDDMLMRLAAFYRTTKDYLTGKIDDPSPLPPADVSGPNVVVADFKGTDPLPPDLPIEAEEEFRILMDYLRMKYGRRKEAEKKEQT
ncbi:MAG: helix-turn-helix domain-containing protein [Limnochordales bacterium]|nr:helix-turn-helix domain-containing protein [Limnochordales bacterium]